jgi:hypothetical protein
MAKCRDDVRNLADDVSAIQLQNEKLGKDVRGLASDMSAMRSQLNDIKLLLQQQQVGAIN